MSDQIQNQVLSVVADALEALNRRVEGFEAALNTLDRNVLGLASNVSGLQSSVSGLQSSVTSVASNVSSLQGSLSSVSAQVAEMQASDAGLVDVLDRVTVVQQAQPPAPPVVAPVPDPAAAVQAAAVQATSAAAAQAAADAQAAAAVVAGVQAAVVAAQAQAAVVAPAPGPVVQVLSQMEIDLGLAFPNHDIVILPNAGGYGIKDSNDTDEVVAASPVRDNPNGHPPFDILPSDFFDYDDLQVVIAR